MEKINFGTEGWRGTLNKTFNKKNIRFFMFAFAEYLKEQSVNSKVLIGYDTRLRSKEFAKYSAKLLQQLDIHVEISENFIHTPLFSFSVLKSESNYGLIFTASHNPANWHGLKIKDRHGSPIKEKEIKRIIKKLEKNKTIADKNTKKIKLIKKYNFEKEYINSISKTIDTSSLNKNDSKIVVDYMYGSTIDWLTKFAFLESMKIKSIHNKINPTFPGMHAPEPIEKNLLKIKNEMTKNKYDLGIAFDGDGDRCGILDENGHYVNSQIIYSLITQYIVKEQKKRGHIIKSVSTTSLLDKIAIKYNCKIIETKIGFKHLSKRLMDKRSIIAGEESGGIAFKNHIPDRDGILTALVIIELLIKSKKKLSQLINDLFIEYGEYFYNREDIEINNDIDYLLDFFTSNEFTSKIKSKIRNITKKDGYKINFTNGSWILIRKSGTEPLIRIYSEMKRKNISNYIVKCIKNNDVFFSEKTF